jgi:hypothetical protein
MLVSGDGIRAGDLALQFARALCSGACNFLPPAEPTVPTFHTVYGLQIEADRPIPGLVPLAELHAAANLQVTLGSARAVLCVEAIGPEDTIYLSPYTDSQGQPSLRIARLDGGAYFGFFYSDGARFAIDREGRRLWADWPEGYSIEDAATYLVGPVLGFVLRLKEITPLHASAVAIEGHAVAFVGPGGAGKSTTAAAFAQLGYSVISDDVVPLQEDSREIVVVPGYPRVNLWPDSVEALLGSPGVLPKITPTWGKHYLPLDQSRCRFESRRLPLGAIYVFGERQPSRSFMEEMPPAEALLSLVANTYVNYVLDRDMRRREFELLSRLVERVPVRVLRAMGDRAGLRSLCEAVAEDFAGVIRGSLAGIGSGAG